MGVLAKPMPAIADDKLSDGPPVIKYRDITVGRGAVPMETDKITICDVPFQCGDLTASEGALTTTGGIDDASKFFVYQAGDGTVIDGFDLAVLGQGKMPPMKVGGTRKVLISPQLGYGEDRIGLREGVGCSKGG